MKQDDPLTGGGSTAFILGAMAFFPPLFDFEFFITAWLGAMQQPVGLSAMVVGGALFAFGKLRQLRNAAPVLSPTDPAAIALAESEARDLAATDLAPTESDDRQPA
jgi:hypothetical protein